MAYGVFRFARNKYKTKNLGVLNSVMFIGEQGDCNRSRVSNRSPGSDTIVVIEAGASIRGNTATYSIQSTMFRHFFIEWVLFTWPVFLTHADGIKIWKGRVFTFVCQCVCFPHDISNRCSCRSTKSLIQKSSTMSPGSPFIMELKGQGLTSRKNIVGVSLCTLVIAGFFS